MKVANTITRTQISFVPLWYSESSGTWMQSTSAQIHTTVPAIPRRSTNRNGTKSRVTYTSTAGSTSVATSSSISRSS